MSIELSDATEYTKLLLKIDGLNAALREMRAEWVRLTAPLQERILDTKDELAIAKARLRVLGREKAKEHFSEEVEK